MVAIIDDGDHDDNHNNDEVDKGLGKHLSTDSDADIDNCVDDSIAAAVADDVNLGGNQDCGDDSQDMDKQTIPVKVLTLVEWQCHRRLLHKISRSQPSLCCILVPVRTAVCKA